MLQTWSEPGCSANDVGVSRAFRAGRRGWSRRWRIEYLGRALGPVFRVELLSGFDADAPQGSVSGLDRNQNRKSTPGVSSGTVDR